MCETAAMNGFATGRLFEPHTLSFHDKVYAESLVVFGGKKSTWIGINAKGGQPIVGPWVYTSTGTELVFENWYKPGTQWDQPENHSGNEKCVMWYPWGTNGEWFDYDCNQKNFFICEFV